MRIGVNGLQLVSDRQGDIVGVNIGYGSCAEHEIDLKELVQRINSDPIGTQLSVGIQPIDTDKVQYSLKLRNKIKKAMQTDAKKLSLTASSPFNGYVIKSSAFTYTRTIKISNANIKDKYSKFLLQDDVYDLLMITWGVKCKYFVDKFRNRKVMNESEIFNMYDYDYARNEQATLQGLNFVGQWDTNGILVLFKHNEAGHNLAEDLADCAKRGYLAIVNREPRLFIDKGCCLFELDRAYFGRR